MKCPKCNTIDLIKGGFDKPFSCPKCSGLWLEVASKAPSLTTLEDSILTDIAETSDQDDKTGLCPAGHGIMIRARVANDTLFYLEKCSACGGIWFDKGELQKILQYKMFENLADFWSRSWQQKQRREKDRKAYLELNKTYLGENIFETVLQLGEMLKNHPEKSRALALLQQEIGL